jgi:two-component system sensor histidine kinase PhcS
MSAGIIHEINNPLNFTNQALFVLKRKGKHLPDAEREHFDRIVADIKDGIGRVSSIVSDLRSFSHPDSGAQNSVDLAEAMQHAVRLMDKTLRDAGVDLDVTMPSPLFFIGDRNQVIQVLINLVQNAVDALKGRAEPCITVTVTEQADGITLKVSDNGCGISSENLQRVFDPFFTTKGVGEGMGLGLSVTYRLVHQMRGSISVASDLGEGTTFSLRFPTPAPPSLPS